MIVTIVFMMKKIWHKNVVLSNLTNEYKLKRLKEFMKELPNETLLSNKLDFIRAMISKVIISVNKNKYKFHIIHNFEK